MRYYKHTMNEYADLFQYVGHTFKYHRKLKELRQIDVSTLAGVGDRYYQEVESGKLQNITIETIYCIAHVLNIELNNLFPKLDEINTYGLYSATNLKKTFNNCLYRSELQEMRKFIMEMPLINHLRNIYNVHSHLLKKFNIEDISDNSGLIWDHHNYPSKQVQSKYNVVAKFPLGKHHVDYRDYSKVTYKLKHSFSEVFFTKQDLFANEKTHQFIFISRTIGLLNKKPLIFYIGKNCQNICNQCDDCFIA